VAEAIAPRYICRMLDVFRKLLFEPADAGANVPSPQRAVAALLVEAAHSDGTFADDERHLIEAFLAEAFDLDAAAASALRAAGEKDQAAAADLVRFTRVIKTTLDESERVAVLEALWRIVLSDGSRHPREDALLRRLAPLLALSDRHSALARQRVAAEE
jgi:uncharacterized tellurite resistance protein B-like protein